MNYISYVQQSQIYSTHHVGLSTRASSSAAKESVWDHVIISNQHCIAQASVEMKCFSIFFSLLRFIVACIQCSRHRISDEDISNRSSKIPSICTQRF